MPPVDTLRVLAHELQVSMDWLLGASDQEPDWGADAKDAPAMRERLDMDGPDVAAQVIRTTGPDLLTGDPRAPRSPGRASRARRKATSPQRPTE